MLSNILLYTVRRLSIALAQSIQGEYVSLIQKNLVTELENMLNVQQWMYVSRMSHLLCEKKKKKKKKKKFIQKKKKKKKKKTV